MAALSSNPIFQTALQHVTLAHSLNYGSQAHTPTEKPPRSDFDACVADIEAGKLRDLIATDQLRAEMAANRVFLGFAEADPNFIPTFKVRANFVLCDGVRWCMCEFWGEGGCM